MKVSVFLAFFLAAVSVSAVSLNVLFTSEDKQPVIKYAAVYNLADSSEIATADMSKLSEYVFDVPENTDVFVLGVASSGKSAEGYYLHEFLPVSKAVSVKTEPVTVELVTEPSFQLVLKNADFPVTGELFAVDMDDRFVPVFRLDVSNSSGKNLPSLNLPLGKCYAFYILKELPVSGRMTYRIDNGGNGYCADSQGNLAVDTDEAAAFSLIARYESLLDKTVVQKDVYEEKLNEIKALYKSGEYRAAAGEAVFQSEELIFEEAGLNINKYRKGKVSVKFKDRDGKPVKGVKVTAVPMRTEYKRGVLAGIYDLDPSIFENAVADGFNFATVGTLWKDVEPEDDGYRWDYMDNVAGNMTIYNFGYELFGHSIIYFLDFVMPEYLKNMSESYIGEEIEEHTKDLVTHYRDSVQEWLVINEAHGYSASNGFSREQITAITKTASNAVTKANPDAVKTINAAPDYFGQNVYVEMFLPDHGEFFSMSSYDYFADLMKQGVDFDVIGQQMYNGGCVTLFKDNGLSDTVSAIPMFDIVEVRRVLRRMESLGKPVYVTEISAPAAMNGDCKDMSYWRKEWNEEVQAEYLERFITVLLGEKDVHAINYWDMQDKGSFVYKGGLMDGNGRKKAAYEAVSGIFGGFLKTVEAGSNEAGTAELLLYAGEYEIAVESGVQEKINVQESEEVTLEYEVDADGNDLEDESPDYDAVEKDGSPEKEKGCSLLLI